MSERNKRRAFEAFVRMCNFNRRRCMNAVSATVLVGTIGMAAMAWAKEETATLPEVVVSGRDKKKSYKSEQPSSVKYTGPLRDIPQTLTVIPQAVMKDQGVTTMRDTLRNVPGISMQAGEGGTPAGDQMTIRGFSARTDIFVDGIRDFGGYTRDPFNFEAVEVAKGPASTYAGRGSTGGSINLVTKKPQPDRSYGGTAGFGTDSYERFTVDVNQPVPQPENAGPAGTALRFNALWHDSDIPGRDVVNDNRWAAAPSVAFGLGTPTQAMLSFFHMKQDNVPGYGVPWVPANTGPLAGYSNRPPPSDWSNFYGLKKRDFEHVTTDLGTAEVKHEFSPDLTLRNQVRFGETLRDSIITSPRFATNSSDVVRTDWKSRDQSDVILTNQTDLLAKFNTAWIGHSVVAGLELMRETEENFNRVRTSGVDSPSTSLYDPNPDDPYRENIQRNGQKADTLAKSAGIYFSDTLKFNEHWELGGGVRWDYFDLRHTPVASQALQRIDKLFSWRVGPVYKPAENGSIYFGYGTSFNPAAEGLTLSTTGSSTANVNSAPEKSETFELGTKWDLFQEKIALAFAVFRTNKNNSRTEDPNDALDIVVLEGEQRVEGMEIGFSGSVTERLKILGGYTYMQSDITKSKNAGQKGRELSNTPKHSFNVWAAYDLPWKLQVGSGARFVDSRFSSFDNNREAPSYWLFDAMLAYKVNERITVRFNGYNLADKEYIDQLSGGHFIPGSGRAATLTTDFEF